MSAMNNEKALGLKGAVRLLLFCTFACEAMYALTVNVEKGITFDTYLVSVEAIQYKSNGLTFSGDSSLFMRFQSSSLSLSSLKQHTVNIAFSKRAP